MCLEQVAIKATKCMPKGLRSELGVIDPKWEIRTINEVTAMD